MARTSGKNAWNVIQKLLYHYKPKDKKMPRKSDKKIAQF
jgi:hypothetical protein